MMHDQVRIKLGRMLAELLAGPCTTQELIDASGFADSTVRDWLRDLRRCHGPRRPGVVRVCDFQAIRGGQVVKPIYELNPDGKPDARRPPKKTGADRAARYRLRKQVLAAGASEAAAAGVVALAMPVTRSK